VFFFGSLAPLLFYGKCLSNNFIDNLGINILYNRKRWIKTKKRVEPKTAQVEPKTAQVEPKTKKVEPKN